MNSYETFVLEYADQLEQVIRSAGRDPVDVTIVFNLFAFDMMGEFAFSKSFGMLKTLQFEKGVKLLRKGVALLGPLSSVPWLARLAFSFPIIPWVRDWNSMMKWAHDCMQERMNVRSYFKHLKELFD